MAAAIKITGACRFLMGILVLIFFGTAAVVLSRQTTIVRWVNDGDTVTLNDGRLVRYIGVNTPEIDHERKTAEPFGFEARRFNAMQVSNGPVRLEFGRQKTDRYGRLLAYVYSNDGTLVNRALLEKGYGYYLHKHPNVKFVDMLLSAQRKAMTQRRGIWESWREKASIYAGNKRSKRFHLQTCPSAEQMRKKNRITFKTRWDAFWAGYAPAGGCLGAGALGHSKKR